MGAEAFCSVAFDPLITRGEDLDYLFNLRMYGFDVWFDNQWCVKHLPPKVPSHAARYLQNVYRWNYEVKKLEASREIISLHHVTPESLRPYPASWIDADDAAPAHLPHHARAHDRRSRAPRVPGGAAARPQGGRALGQVRRARLLRLPDLLAAHHGIAVG